MVTRAQIQELADRIAAGFAVERIILFGSQANGTATADSDVDIMVIMEFEGRPFDMSVRIACAVRPRFACDLIVRTPADAERRYRQHDPFVRHSFDSGEVLYERSLARVG